MNHSNVATRHAIQTTQAEQPTVQQWLFPTILRSFQWDEDTKLGQVQLCTQEYNWHCATFNNYFIHFLFQDEVTGYARIIQSVNQANEPIYVMVDFKLDDSLKALYLAHPEFCPIEGVVEQTRSLVQGIQNTGIKRLLENALSMDSVSANFWTCQASLRDHHAYAGGLAEHSLEVATMIASSNLEIEYKDIGIAFALLHDIGKIYSYAHGTLTEYAREVGHERIGYQFLDTFITELEQEDAKAGHSLRELLNGNWKRTTKDRRPLAIGRVVNAFDQLSCERNLQKPIKNPPANSFHRDDLAFFEP